MTEPTSPPLRLGPLPPPETGVPRPEGGGPPSARTTETPPERDLPPAVGPPPTPPEDRRPKRAIGCLTLIGGALGLLVVALVWGSSVFRPFPSPPPTGVLETTHRQPIRLGPGDQTAELDMTMSLTGQLDGGNRTTGWPNEVAPVVVMARLSVPGGSAASADLTIEAMEATPSFAVDADVAAAAEAGVVDAVRWGEPCNARTDCIRRYRIDVTRRGGDDDQPLELTLFLTSRLEYPTNVPAPKGAALRLAVASSPTVAPRMLIQATRPETITLNPGAPAVVRDITAVYPASDGGSSGLHLRLAVDLTPIGKPSPQPTSLSGRAVTGPLARVTLGEAGPEPILVRDLTGGPMDVRLAPLGVCAGDGTCSLTLRAIIETLDPRPDASYRLQWSIEGRRTAGPGNGHAPRISVVPVKPIEVARAEGSGELTLTRLRPGATGTALVILVPARDLPPDPSASGRQAELQAVATVTVTAEISGSTRRAQVIVTVGPAFEENGAPAVITARVGAPGSAVFRPLRSCKTEGAQCEEGYRIDAALAPSVSAIMTSAETVTVRWRMTVTLGSLGSAPSPDGQLPTLVVQ
jgi:hypothetical protein